MTDQEHTTRGRRILVWGGLALLLCLAVFAVPQAWIEPITALLGEPPAPDAFSNQTSRLDEALTAGDARLTEETLALVPHVVARRLTRAGPMTEADAARAAEIWERAMRNADAEPPEGSREAHYQAAERKIVETFRRLDEERVRAELRALRSQVEAARGSGPGGGGEVDALDCAGCHSETRALPGERRFDATGIYPFIADDPAFDGGRRFPVLVESIELRGAARRDEDLAGTECLNCHVPHDNKGFEVELDERIENMGLWVEALRTDPGVVHLVVKTKTSESGHRVPAGKISPAYVVTVEATQGGDELPLRLGTRLPRHLRTKGRDAGLAFGRHYVDAAGSVTTDPSRIADLLSDSRLASGRFAQKNFVFDRLGAGEVRLEVVLWHLPDYQTWKGARAVRRVKSTERDEFE